jgi:hypothetical protein
MQWFKSLFSLNDKHINITPEEPCQQRVKANKVIDTLENFCNTVNEEFAKNPVSYPGKKIKIFYNCKKIVDSINDDPHRDTVDKFDENRKTHINQVQTAMQFIPNLINNKYKQADGKHKHILINGSMQAGKTGVLCMAMHGITIYNFVNRVLGLDSDHLKKFAFPQTPNRTAIQESLKKDYEHFLGVYGEINVELWVDGTQLKTSTIKGIYNKEEKDRKEAFEVVRSKCENDSEFWKSIGEPDFATWESTLDLNKKNPETIKNLFKYMKQSGYTMVPVSDEVHWGAGDNTRMDKIFEESDVFTNNDNFWIGVTATGEMYSNCGDIENIDFIFPSEVKYTGFPFRNGSWTHRNPDNVIVPEIYTYEEIAEKSGISFLTNIDGATFKNINRYKKQHNDKNPYEPKNVISSYARLAAQEAGVTNEEWYSETDNKDYRSAGLEWVTNADLSENHKTYKRKFTESLAELSLYFFKESNSAQREGMIVRAPSNAVAEELRSMMLFHLDKLKKSVKITIYNGDSQQANLEDHLLKNQENSQRIGENDKFICIVTGACRMAERVPNYIKWAIHLGDYQVVDCDSILQDLPGRLSGYNKGKTTIILSQNGATWLKSYVASKGRITLRPKHTKLSDASSDKKDLHITVDKLINIGQKHGCEDLMRKCVDGLNASMKAMCEAYYPTRPTKIGGKLSLFSLKDINPNEHITEILVNDKIRESINAEYFRGDPDLRLLKIGETVGNRKSPQAYYNTKNGRVLFHCRPNWADNPNPYNTDVGSVTEYFKVSVNVMWVDPEGNPVPADDNIGYAGYAVVTGLSFRTTMDTHEATRQIRIKKTVPNAGVPYETQTHQQRHDNPRKVEI